MQSNISSDIPYVARILENIRKVIEEDRAQKQPLILKISEAFLFNIARKAILEKNSTFLVSIAGESASGKTTLVNNTAKACVRSNADIYTVISCDDYYKDASKELTEAESKAEGAITVNWDLTKVTAVEVTEEDKNKFLEKVNNFVTVYSNNDMLQHLHVLAKEQQQYDREVDPHAQRGDIIGFRGY